MNQMQHNKSSLFLMELIIAILFFAISGVVCVRLFVNAHVLSNSSVNINNSCLWTQNICEIFASSKGDLDKISSYYSECSIVRSSEADNNKYSTMILYFDKDWEVIEFPADDEEALSDACYEVMLRVSKLPANIVYADVEGSENLTGDALLGEIAIIEIKEGNTTTDFPASDSDRIISRSTTDCYIGKEG